MVKRNTKLIKLQKNDKNVSPKQPNFSTVVPGLLRHQQNIIIELWTYDDVILKKLTKTILLWTLKSDILLDISLEWPYVGLLVQHLLPLLNPWIILEMQALLWQMLLWIGSTGSISLFLREVYSSVW